MPPEHERNVVHTYRYLRAAMIALLLMLIFSVGYQWWWETGRNCWLGSISAYYYTPARTIFVGSLCALGACLIAYKGHSPEEDVLLNFSGFMAFVVAIVPTAPDILCGPNAYSQTLPEIASAVRNNIWSLIVVTLLAAIIGLWLRRRSLIVRSERRLPPGRTTVAERSTLAVVISVACGFVLAAEMILFLVLRPRFIEVSHGIAAITMVAGVIAVMVFSALRTEERHEAIRGRGVSGNRKAWSPERYRTIYLVIAGVLVITLVIALLAAWMTSFDHLILWVEFIVIVLFGTYWAVQTRELWNLTEEATTAAVVPGVRPEESATTHERPLDTPSTTPPGHVLDHDVEGREAHTVAE